MRACMRARVRVCTVHSSLVQEFADYRNVLLATPIEDDFGSDILDTHEEPLTSLFNRPTTIVLKTQADERKVGSTVKSVCMSMCWSCDLHVTWHGLSLIQRRKCYSAAPPVSALP